VIFPSTAKEPKMPKTESIDGPTPNGGVRSVIRYQNKEGQPVDKKKAVKCEVVELDASGDEVFRTYADLE
jgi:hypothetical protein